MSSDIDIKATLPANALPPLMARLESAMQEATQHAAHVEAEHRAAFTLHMREKLGVAAIALEESHLPKRLLYESLRYVHGLDKIAGTLGRMAGEDGFRTTQFNPNAPMGPQLERRIALAQTRHALQMKQALDLDRQRGFGFTHYIWRTQDDDKVRAEHAELNGDIRSFNDPGPHPGEDYGCRCWAEPTLLGSDKGDRLPEPPLEPAYGLEVLAVIAAAASVMILTRVGPIILTSPPAQREAIRIAREAGKEITESPKPAETIPPAAPKPEGAVRFGERPRNVPKEWKASPAQKGEGTRYRDPKNIHNEVRVQKGKPEVSNPWQQKDYVRWKRNGQWLDKDGKPSLSPEDTHIPADDFDFNPEIFK